MASKSKTTRKDARSKLKRQVAKSKDRDKPVSNPGETNHVGTIHARLSTHPPVLFAYGFNNVELIVDLSNKTNEIVWGEADVHLSDRISLNPTQTVNKGRMKIGIIEPNKYVKKSVKVYANGYTNPNIYPARVTIYVYGKDATIYKRIEKTVDIRCEIKRKPVL